MSEPTNAVHLEIPASPEFVLVARLAAAGMATRAGLTYDDIADVKVIAGECCQLLITERPGEGSIRLAYAVENGHLTIEATREAAALDPVADDDLSVLLLSALTDDVDIATLPDGRRVRATKLITR